MFWKKILFILIIILLSLPAIQKTGWLFNENKLDGDFVLTEKPKLDFKTLYSGAFQNNFNKYIEDHIGFRNILIRLKNTIEFYAFNKSIAEGVIVGKNNILFEHDYIRAYHGEDFIGKISISRKLRRLKFLQKYLKETQNIDIILCLEPSKIRFMPEFLPDKYRRKDSVHTNYDYLVKVADSLNLNYIDINKYFIQLKGKSEYPLFPKYGTHWSNYGSSIGADTIFNTFEKLAGYNLRNFKVNKYKVSKTPKHPDYDIGKACNLLWMLPAEELAIPELSYQQFDKTGNLLVVGDSFYWTIFNSGTPDSLFSGQDFWYYNKSVYPDFYTKKTKTNSLNLKTEVEKRSAILITITERFLRNFAWKFIDNLYTLYAPEMSYEKIIKKENDIRDYDKWFNKIIMQSKSRNTSIQNMVNINAKYFVLTANKKDYINIYGPKHYIEKITNNKKLHKAIVKRAKKINVPLNELIRKDAWSMLKKDYPEIEKEWREREKIRFKINTDLALQSEIQRLKDYYYLNNEEAIDVLIDQKTSLNNISQRN